LQVILVKVFNLIYTFNMSKKPETKTENNITEPTITPTQVNNQPTDQSYQEPKNNLGSNLSNSLAGYSPPSDYNAEGAMLGLILLNNSNLDEVADKLKPVFFADPRNQRVYQSMINLSQNNKPIDVLFTLNQLDYEDNLQASNRNHKKSGVDKDYLIDLVSKTSLVTSVTSLLTIIKDKYKLRQVLEVSEEIKEMVISQTENSNDILDQAQKKLFEASVDSSDKNFVAIGDILMDSFERLADTSGDIDNGIPTGFIDIDKKLGGLHNSDLIILAARPAMGKTSFTLEIAKRIAMIQQVGVAIFSLEMSKEQLVDKLISSTSGVDSWKLRTRKFDESADEFSKIGEAISRLAEAPIWIDDGGALNVLELRTKARRLKTKHNVGVIIIDYLQLMSGTGRNYSGNRVQEVSEISRGLKILAKELSVPIIALSQLSRSVEGRDDKRPMLSDLRESGSIEQDADVVMFIHRDEMYNKETKKKGIADIIVAKHRHGETCSVELGWIGRLATFENLDQARVSSRINE
jgi:replicative DNA helicase